MKYLILPAALLFAAIAAAQPAETAPKADPLPPLGYQDEDPIDRVGKSPGSAEVGQSAIMLYQPPPLGASRETLDRDPWDSPEEVAERDAEVAKAKAEAEAAAKAENEKGSPAEAARTVKHEEDEAFRDEAKPAVPATPDKKYVRDRRTGRVRLAEPEAEVEPATNPATKSANNPATKSATKTP